MLRRDALLRNLLQFGFRGSARFGFAARARLRLKPLLRLPFRRCFSGNARTRDLRGQRIKVGTRPRKCCGFAFRDRQRLGLFMPSRLSRVPHTRRLERPRFGMHPCFGLLARGLFGSRAFFGDTAQFVRGLGARLGRFVHFDFGGELGFDIGEFARLRLAARFTFGTRRRGPLNHGLRHARKFLLDAQMLLIGLACLRLERGTPLSGGNCRVLQFDARLCLGRESRFGNYARLRKQPQLALGFGARHRLIL